MSAKVGRPKGSGKYPIRKHIYISEEMNKKWSPNKIRAFLESNGKVNSDRDSNKNQLVDKIVFNLKKSIENYKIEELRQLDIRTREKRL